jgi:hypothetical protein
MQGKINWALGGVVICAVAGVGGAFALINSKDDNEPDYVYVAPPEGTINPTVPTSSNTEGTTRPEKPRETITAHYDEHHVDIRHWSVPAPDDLEKLEKHSYDVIELVANENGSRALARSRKEIHLIDLKTGKLQQTYRPAKPRWDYQKPDTHFMFLSRDARYLAVGSEASSSSKVNTKEMAILDARSGKTLGSGTLDKDIDLFHTRETGTFSAAGDYLLLPSTNHKEFFIQAISTETGAAKYVTIPNANKIEAQMRLLLPVPQEPMFIIYRDRVKPANNPGGISSLDLRTGKETLITAINIKAWALFYDHGVQLSPDGKLLLVQATDKVQLCDWRANKLLLQITGNMEQFGHPRFTPDGKRFIIVRSPQYEILRFGGGQSGIEQVPMTLELFDIATQEKLGEFKPVEHEMSGTISALAISGDGKTLTVGMQREVYVLDFKSTFGVDPLPPLPRLSGPDQLPLK